MFKRSPVYQLAMGDRRGRAAAGAGDRRRVFEPGSGLRPFSNIFALSAHLADAVSLHPQPLKFDSSKSCSMARLCT